MAEDEYEFEMDGEAVEMPGDESRCDASQPEAAGWLPEVGGEYEATDMEMDDACADDDARIDGHVHSRTASPSQVPAAAVGGGAAGAAADASAAVLPSGRPGLFRQGSVESADLRSLSGKMEKEIAHVEELLCVTKDEACFMLMHMKWKRNAVENAYFEDADEFRRQVGITAGPEGRPAPPPFGGDSFFDETSLEDVPWSEGDALPCGHWFSKSAWQQHVSAAMDLPEGDMLALRCPYFGCTERVRRRIFVEYLTPTALDKYDLARLRSFATTNPRCRCCPGVDCDQVVMYEGGEHDVTCGRGHSFCFKCGGEAHAPASCKLMKHWMIRFEKEGGNTKWLLANTKPWYDGVEILAPFFVGPLGIRHSCSPKCKRSIEKNQGCNHMTCRHSGCGHEFCWICGGVWNSHGGYSCNKPEDNDWYDASGARAAASELEHVAFFESRFENHDRSMRLAEKLLPIVEKSIQSMTVLLPADQASFLALARNATIRGRRIAKWSYVHSFYLPAGVELQLFQNQQKMLETWLEQLQEAIEGGEIERILAKLSHDHLNTVKGQLYEYRDKVVHLTSATEKFATNISEDPAGAEKAALPPASAASPAATPAQAPTKLPKGSKRA